MFWLLVATASAVPAHAKVTGSNPAAGSTVSQAPTTISVTTAENMKSGPSNSNLQVYGPNGELISQGDATVDLNNPQLMSIKIKPSGKGVYVVRWNTVSEDDGDPDQGAFTFTVGAPVVAKTAPAAPAASSSIPLWVPIVAGIVALLVGLGIGFAIARGTRAATSGNADVQDTEPMATKRS